MPWQSRRYGFGYDYPVPARPRIRPSALNEQCFIRKQHNCGKMYGASKSCFIACPTNDDLETILELMSEKLTKLGIEPIIAVKERAYGQDIFCTKICGKIIESRFCIVILDDTMKNKIDVLNVPNPNVYYEYGLMTSLRKHIIPLQREDLKLAFNIQSYDTIKYNTRNIGTELDRAIRDAIKLTDAIEPQETKEALADKVILRKMELAGFKVNDEKWFLTEVINDTGFRGFEHREKKFYVYMGKIDTADDAKIYLDDLDIVVYRTEKEVKSLQQEIETLKEQSKLIAEQEEARKRDLETLAAKGTFRTQPFPSKAAIKREIQELESRINATSTMYIAFVVISDVNTSDFIKASRSMTAGNERYRIVFTEAGRIEFGDICVDFTASQH